MTCAKKVDSPQATIKIAVKVAVSKALNYMLLSPLKDKQLEAIHSFMLGRYN